MRSRNLLFTGVTAIIVTALLSSPPFGWARGLSVDILFWLRDQVFDPAYSPAAFLYPAEGHVDWPDRKDPGRPR